MPIINPFAIIAQHLAAAATNESHQVLSGTILAPPYRQRPPFGGFACRGHLRRASETFRGSKTARKQRLSSPSVFYRARLIARGATELREAANVQFPRCASSIAPSEIQ
ncbi:MAG: hypothetical protein WB946_07550, partial [Halobacteriota archaeon]